MSGMIDFYFFPLPYSLSILRNAFNLAAFSFKARSFCNANSLLPVANESKEKRSSMRYHYVFKIEKTLDFRDGESRMSL